MKTFRLTIFVALVLCFSVGVSGAQADTPQLRTPPDLTWHSYENGMKLAKEEKKDVFIEFYGDWCEFCKKMDEITFRHPVVAEFLDKHFILIKVDEGKNEKLVKKYYVRSFPWGYFIDSEGKDIGPAPGYWEPDQFLSLLNFVISDSYQKMTYKEFAKRQ
jgi:thioredoxin-related protein